MSYDQVVQIVGGPGELLSEVGGAQVYMWVGSGGLGANAKSSSMTDASQGKAQFGLS
jgi:hypothetical protein